MSSTSVARTQAHAEASHSTARPLGWYGMIFFIASEAVFFANLIAAYLYLRVRAMGLNGGKWPIPAEIANFHIELAHPLIAVNTVILISSSIPMVLARRAAARGNRTGLIWGLVGTIVLGATFLSIQLYEYTHSAFGAQSGIFGSTFYTLTGFHGAHVTAGVLFLCVCLGRSIRGDFTAKRHFAVEAAEMYWHFVDIVWVVLFSLLYLFGGI